MEITILGSGTGVPALNRNASGLIVEVENKNLLFDTGPGIVRRLLERGLSYHDIDYIFYTHFHTDHTLDLSAFLFAARYTLSLRTKGLEIIGPCGLKRLYAGFLELYPDVIEPEAYRLSLREIKEEFLQFDGYEIETRQMLHTPQSLGYRLEAGGRSIVYSGDTDVCENIVKLGRGADILILDCSFPDEMKAKGHLTPAEAGRIALECGCKRLVLSHLYPVCIAEHILEQAKRAFGGEITVAYDLLRMSV